MVEVARAGAWGRMLKGSIATRKKFQSLFWSRPGTCWVPTMRWQDGVNSRGLRVSVGPVDRKGLGHSAQSYVCGFSTEPVPLTVGAHSFGDQYLACRGGLA